MTKTKKVEFTLTATVSMTYTETLEVPADITPYQLESVAMERYQHVESAKFKVDPMSREMGECSAKDVSASSVASGAVNILDDGEIIYKANVEPGTPPSLA